MNFRRPLILLLLWTTVPGMRPALASGTGERCRKDVELWGLDPDRAKLTWILNSLDYAFANQPPNTAEGRETLALFQNALRELSRAGGEELLPLLERLRDKLRAQRWDVAQLPTISEYSKIRSLASVRGISFTPALDPRLALFAQWKTGYAEREVHSTFALSHGGKYLFMGAEGTSQVWDVVKGKRVSLLDLAPQGPTHAVFLPDGKQVAVAFRDFQGYGVWDLTAGKLLEGQPRMRFLDKDKNRIHGDAETLLAVAPGNRWLVTSTIDRDAIYLWDRIAKKPVDSFNDFNVIGMGVEQLFFNQDGTKLVTISDWPRVVRVWAVDKKANGLIEYRPKKHRIFERAAFLEGEERLVFLSYDEKTKHRYVHAMDLKTGEELTSFEFPVDPMALSPDGRFVVYLRDAQGKKPRLELRSTQTNKLFHREALDGEWKVLDHGISSDSRFLYLSEGRKHQVHRMSVFAIEEP